MNDANRIPRADAKLKRLPDEVQAHIVELCSKPGVTQRAILDWIEKECDVRSSSAALSLFLSWYVARKAAKENEQRVMVYLDEERQLHPEIPDGELFAKGQRLFSLMAIARQDPKVWTDVQRAQRDWADSQLSQEKFKQQLKTDLERGLEALYEHIKGIPEALKAFEQLQGVVTRATK